MLASAMHPRSPMALPPHGPSDDELVDETAAESFPASDSPSWTAMHLGGPSPRPWVSEHGHELRAALRADIERLSRAAAAMGTPRGAETRALGEAGAFGPQDVVARAILDAGRAVIREPVDDALTSWNVEAEQLGADRASPCIVVGARCLADDATGAAMLLAVVRGLASARMRRAVRFVAFGSESGSSRFADRLRTENADVYAMISLARLDLARTRRKPMVNFVSNLRSSFAARAARDAFRGSSRIRARALVLPSWLPGIASSDHAAFWRQGWPAVIITDAAPWQAAGSGVIPDLDGMAAAVPGLVAAIARLAGGRI
jgi:hypothetical protein